MINRRTLTIPSARCRHTRLVRNMTPRHHETFEPVTLAHIAVAFHELGHWTGDQSRLDRDLRHRFGERAYAAEELVAELCAAFLCAEFSIDGDLRHAGYIQSWMGPLESR
jgi:antirestriction protein ArdC